MTTTGPSKNDYEIRSSPDSTVSLVEIRSEPKLKDPVTPHSIAVLSGVAMVYGYQQTIRNILGDDLYVEAFTKSAFKKTIQEKSKIRVLNDHQWTSYLASTENRSLRLNNTKDALEFELDLPNTSEGRDVLALVDREDYKGSSVGFVVKEEKWQGLEDRNDSESLPSREIRQAQLLEISLTGDPAFSVATVSRRSLVRLADEKGLDVEQLYLASNDTDTFIRSLAGEMMAGIEESSAAAEKHQTTLRYHLWRATKAF